MSDVYIRKAAERLLGQWAEVPAEFLANKIGQECYGEGAGPGPVPMWGTVFKVQGMDRGNVKKLLRPLGPPEDDADEMFDWLADHDGDADYFNEYDESSCGDPRADWDTEGLHRAMCEWWWETDDEKVHMNDVGWQAVGDTGLFAYEYDDDIFIGVNSAGHDFYDSYWIPLYKELGYNWHKDYERREVFGSTARDVQSLIAGNLGKVLAAFKGNPEGAEVILKFAELE